MPDVEQHRSIGEVLTLLQEDFPDITISKIRFLESQGLLDPERTPSGYRKFYATDIERLRWILRQQKEHFLPLKVIKGRLDAGEPTTDGDVDPAQAIGAIADGGPAVAPAGRRITADELASQTGVSSDVIGELRRLGLLTGERVGGELVFGASDIAIAEVAARLISHGLEPRHLRSLQMAVERELSMYQQILLPRRRGGDAEADRETQALLEELCRHGDDLRAGLLQSVVDAEPR